MSRKNVPKISWSWGPLSLSTANVVSSVMNIVIAVDLLAHIGESLYKHCISIDRNWSLGGTNLLWKQYFFFFFMLQSIRKIWDSGIFKGDGMVLGKNCCWHGTHHIWELSGVIVSSTDCAATSENNAWRLAKLFLKYHLGDHFPLLRPQVAKAIEGKITQSNRCNVKANRQESW